LFLKTQFHELVSMVISDVGKNYSEDVGLEP
jgi:hypothetical protein